MRSSTPLPAASADVLLVTNEVGMGVVPATASGRLFRDLLGIVNVRVAAACQETTLVVAGMAVPLAPARVGSSHGQLTRYDPPPVHRRTPRQAPRARPGRLG